MGHACLHDQTCSPPPPIPCLYLLSFSLTTLCWAVICLPGCLLITLDTLSHLISTTTLWNGYYYHKSILKIANSVSERQRDLLWLTWPVSVRLGFMLASIYLWTQAFCLLCYTFYQWQHRSLCRVRSLAWPLHSQEIILCDGKNTGLGVNRHGSKPSSVTPLLCDFGWVSYCLWAPLITSSSSLSEGLDSLNLIFSYSC